MFELEILFAIKCRTLRFLKKGSHIGFYQVDFTGDRKKKIVLIAGMSSRTISSLCDDCCSIHFSLDRLTARHMSISAGFVKIYSYY